MAVPLEQFVQQLEESGILAGDTLQNFIPPKAAPKDAEELARELIRQKKLTAFQADEVCRGKGNSLVLGNYVLLEKVGSGGMGQVFKAEHRRMKRVVAVKLLPAAMTNDKAAIARFEREVEAAAKICHPNIVAAHDADEANGVHFLVMELVEGSDLSALVKKHGPLPVEKAVSYILQAAKGLEAAHGKGIIHRDIKPANLLLDKAGIVKILDMGLARLSGDGEGPAQADLTSTGTIMGTVDYMAPEQALDTKTADARADIYSLGCSLFYLLSGKAAYHGDTLMKKLLAHREQPIPSLRAARAEVPETLEVVFNKMLAKHVEDRYQTMTEVVAALETVASREPACSVKSEVATAWVPSAEERKTLGNAGGPKPTAMPLTPLVQVVASEKSKHVFAKIVGGTFASIIAPILVTFLIKYLETDHSPPNPPTATPSVAVIPPAAVEAEIPERGARGAEPSGSAGTPQRSTVAATEPARPASGEAGNQPADDMEDRRAAEWVLRKGGVISIDANGTEMTIGKQFVTDLVAIDVLPKGHFQLHTISLQHIRDISDADLVRLKDLKNLSRLYLHGTSVTAVGLQQFQELPGLRFLSYGNGGIGDAAMQALLRLKQLTHLELLTGSVTSENVRSLEALPSLVELSLGWDDLDGATFIRIGELTKLKSLSLTYSRFNEGDLQKLKTLTALEELILSYTPLTDSALVHLGAFRNLKSLNLKGTKITAAGIAALRKTLPNCTIDR